MSCCALFWLAGIERERGRERDGEDGGFNARPYTVAALDRLEYPVEPVALYESWYGLWGPKREPVSGPGWEEEEEEEEEEEVM